MIMIRKHMRMEPLSSQEEIKDVMNLLDGKCDCDKCINLRRVEIKKESNKKKIDILDIYHKQKARDAEREKEELHEYYRKELLKDGIIISQYEKNHKRE